MSTNIKPRVFDGFGRLIVAFKRGDFKADSPHHVYYFASMREGAPTYVGKDRGYGLTESEFQELMTILDGAVGRVFWRLAKDSWSTDDHPRFLAFLEVLRGMGVDVPVIDLQTEAGANLVWSRPSLEEFLGDSVDWGHHR